MIRLRWRGRLDQSTATTARRTVDVGTVNNERFKIIKIEKNIITIQNENKTNCFGEVCAYADVLGLHMLSRVILVKVELSICFAVS